MQLGTNFGFMDSPILRGNTHTRRNRVNERIAQREREMQIRERENEIIRKIKEEIARVESSDMADDLKRLTLMSLGEQIQQIHDNRSEREQLAIEREMRQNKMEQEERQREKEERGRAKAERHMDQEEAMERAIVRDLSLIGARMDSISSLKTTRARMVSEASQLEQDLENSKTLSRDAAQQARQRNAMHGTIGPEHVISTSSNPKDFRQTHLQNLNEGISRLDSTINSQVAALYRDSVRMQETQLELAENNDREEEYIDMRL